MVDNSDNDGVNDDNVGLVIMMVMMVVLMMMVVVVWLGGSWWTKRGNWKTKAGWPLPPPPLWVDSGAHLRLTKKERVAHNKHASNWNRSLSSKLLNWDRSHPSEYNKRTTRQQIVMVIKTYVKNIKFDKWSRIKTPRM